MTENQTRHEVTYDIAHEDLYAFQLRTAQRSPVIRKTLRNIYVSIFVLFLLLGIYPLFGPGPIEAKAIMLGLPLIGFPFFVVIGKFIERWIVSSTIQKVIADEKPGGGVLGRHTLVLDDDGVVEKTRVNESRTLWAGIDRVEDDADYAFIYVSAAAAHVVPLRAFENPEQARAFVSYARSRSGS